MRGRSYAAAGRASPSGRPPAARALWRRLYWLLAALALMLVSVAVAAAPERTPEVAAGDCQGCHHERPVLPSGHAATRQMTLSACRACHAPASPRTLAGVLPGSHLHALSGVTCARCHGTAKPLQEVAFERCTSCHETASLARSTAGLKPANPHDSPHYGKDADCNLCHHQHARSEDYCARCHDFGFTVP